MEFDMKNPFEKDYLGPEPKEAVGSKGLSRVQGKGVKTAIGPELQKWLMKNKTKAGAMLRKLPAGARLGGAAGTGLVAGTALAKLFGGDDD